MESLYIEYSFEVEPLQPATEILIAQLGELNFESFVENEKGIDAYIQKKHWNESILENVWILNSEEFSIQYRYKEIAQTNWNQEWENNFSPIQVDKKVSVRAPFHENPLLEYDIIIEPKMSFGTGHHETTHMMIQQLLEIDLVDKTVLDMGCGTGILAIFAEMKGAIQIDAIDIDSWCYENSVENAQRNNCERISVFEGDAALLQSKKYDVIIANINRNILLQDMDIYIESLQNSGQLLLSGFYKEDIPILDNKVSSLGLILEKTFERNNWISLRYQK